MLRSTILALCAALFTAACATVPPPPADVPIMETPRWISGELVINFTVEPSPSVKLCIGGKCDVKLELMGRIKDGTSALLYPIPEDRALRYDEIHVVPSAWPDGSPHWVVYTVSRNFGNDGCTRWFLAIPAQGEHGGILPDGNRFTLAEELERQEGCNNER